MRTFACLEEHTRNEGDRLRRQDGGEARRKHGRKEIGKASARREERKTKKIWNISRENRQRVKTKGGKEGTKMVGVRIGRIKKEEVRNKKRETRKEKKGKYIKEVRKTLKKEGRIEESEEGWKVGMLRRKSRRAYF